MLVSPPKGCAFEYLIGQNDSFLRLFMWCFIPDDTAGEANIRQEKKIGLGRGQRPTHWKHLIGFHRSLKHMWTISPRTRKRFSTILSMKPWYHFHFIEEGITY